jgi:uncharacterized damage-inducible protein DinB
MDKSFLLQQWANIRQSLYQALEQIPSDTSYYSWRPSPESFSLAELVYHIGSAEEGWLSIASLKEPLWSALPDDITPQGIKDYLISLHDKTLTFFENLSDQDLNQTVSFTPSSGSSGSSEEFTLSYILWHLIEHEIHHRAQLLVYMRSLKLIPSQSLS